MVEEKKMINRKIVGFMAIFVFIFCITSIPVLSADVTGPTCTLISQTPSDILQNSTGTFEVIINCTDASGINLTSFITTKTVEGKNNAGIPNYWSIRYPDHDEAEVYTDIHGNEFQILKADGRFDDKWYDHYNVDGNPLFSDNYSYSVQDNSSIKVTITDYVTSAVYNWSGQLEPYVFRSAVPISRGKLEKELKQEYDVYKNHPLLVKWYDIEIMRGNINHTLCPFYNIQYSTTPTDTLNVYVCNESYDMGAGVSPMDEIDNCAYATSHSTSDLDIIEFTSRESSYSSSCFAVQEGMFAGINLTDINYVYYESATLNAVKGYKIRYVDGATDTNVSFADTNISWSSTDEGETFSPSGFTPDIWFATFNDEDEFQMGYYVEDMVGNNATNFTFITDTIGEINNPILNPNIQSYHKGEVPWGDESDEDKDKNGTYYGNMTIHINMAIDPDNIGTVNHSLYLYNADDTLNQIINESFYSPDDSDMHMYVDIIALGIADGTYKYNITATADDDTNDVKSYLESNSFTIDSTPPDMYLLYPSNNSHLPADTTEFELSYNTTSTNVDTATFLWTYGSASGGNTSSYVLADVGNLMNISGGITNGNQYRFTLTLNDTAGNTNSTEYTIGVATGIDGGTGSETPSGGTTPTESGTDEEEITIELLPLTINEIWTNQTTPLDYKVYETAKTWWDGLTEFIETLKWWHWLIGVVAFMLIIWAISKRPKVFIPLGGGKTK